MREAHPAIDDDAPLIGTAMSKRSNHAFEITGFDAARSKQTRYAAHSDSLSFSACVFSPVRSREGGLQG